jgi:hypothetical protein
LTSGTWQPLLRPTEKHRWFKDLYPCHEEAMDRLIICAANSDYILCLIGQTVKIGRAECFYNSPGEMLPGQTRFQISEQETLCYTFPLM